MYSATGGPPPWQTNVHPAYIQVPTRNPYASATQLPPPPTYVPQPLHQSLPAMNTSPASSASSEPRKKIEWPPAVRDYVNRCFAAENQLPGIERSEMEKRLKEVITNAAHSNQLMLHNWETMPLPQEMIREDRKRATLGYQAISSSFLPPPPPALLSFPPGMHTQPAGTEILRKRKSSELNADAGHGNQPPWRTNKKITSLEDRISAPEKRQKIDIGSSPSKSNESLEKRKKRFEDARSGSNSPHKATFAASPPVAAEPLGPVVGRSQKLEKNYLRLTSAPNPEDVRPLDVLQKTLDLLKKKWKDELNYSYINNQFKSLRQDLTVQHIQNEFTTTVYEIHARIALEKGDLGEYNQCQTKLRTLYQRNLGGHPTEFKAYRILYTIYTCNKTDMNDVLSDLTPLDKQNKAVKHALAVRSALALGNYHQFFRLYLDVPNMGAYLMDMFVERERLAALALMNRAYKPNLRLRYITEELAFESDEEAAQFILDHGGEELLTDTKDGVMVRLGTRIFEDAKAAAFNQVDIKGQI